MLINSVVIILREVLEAALIISVLLALSQKLHFSKKWLIHALLLGCLGAVLYAFNIQALSLALEGIGQEVVNAIIQILLCIGIALFIVAIKSTHNISFVSWVMISCVSLAIIREGSEIIIYIQGLMGILEFRSPVLIGSIIGTGIGMSVGVFFYYLIVNLSFNKSLYLGLFLLVLIAGGMTLQSTQLLLQVDLITSQPALWDSSSFINEHSLMGQLLYALIGYEATPTPIQICTYLLNLIIMLFLTIRTLKHFKWREKV